MSAFLKIALCPAPFQKKKQKPPGKPNGSKAEPQLARIGFINDSVPQFQPSHGRLPPGSIHKSGSVSSHRPHHGSFCPSDAPGCKPPPYTHISGSSHLSGGSHSPHTSGYQSGYATDDGSFESQILSRATKERPANLRMTAIRDYAPCCNEELSVRKGQRVKVLYRQHDWVFAVTKHGHSGYLPFSYVRPSRKYNGYQSEPECARDDLGYETDITSSHGYPIPRNRPELPPSYSINTACRRVGSGSPIEASVVDASGYMSCVEGPTYRASVSRQGQSNYRPVTVKPPIDSFSKKYIEELVVIHDFEAKEENEVFVSKGQRVRVVNADDENWLWVVTLHSGEEGFIPRSCCTLGNHPSLSSPTLKGQMRLTGRRLQSMDAQRRPHYSRHNIHHRNMRMQAKDRFRQLALLKNAQQNPVTIDKEEIKKIGTRLIVLMDFEATVDDELSVEFAEPLVADVLGQNGAEKIWAYCPRTDKCGYVPMSLVVPPVV